MRQWVSDEQIESAIASLFATEARWADGIPGVRDVAKALRARVGHAGTNERIRAALNRVRARPGAAPEPAQADIVWAERARELQVEVERKDQKIGELQRELAAMRERAELAEHRELAHQDMYLGQIYDLRQELKAREALRPRGVHPDVYLAAKRELHAAQCENAELRARLSETEPRPKVEEGS